MRARTKEFLISRFREYYISNSLEVPPSLDSREWGFIFFDEEKGMHRHKSYLRRNELLDYVRSIVPAHIYHSAAYYQKPSAPTMKEKIWKGADLIFDLDADHIRKAPNSYGEMLALVKKETFRLLTFLTDDFGFDERSMNVVFSGGRGYHIHVRHPIVLSLKNDERREIVDYLTGRGLDIKSFIFEVPVTGDYGSKKRARSYRVLAQGSAGWGGRINRSLVSFITNLRDLDEEEAIRGLCKIKGIKKNWATNFYEIIISKNIIEEIRQGRLDLFKGSPNIWGNLLKDYLEGEGVGGLAVGLDEEWGETDEPVTTDTKRLIRCPGSLHGGSGFRVTPLSIQNLEDFDPLWDAVVFGGDPVPVEIITPFNIEIRGQNNRLDIGHTELPLHTAVFLMARGAAELGKVLDGDTSK